MSQDKFQTENQFTDFPPAYTQQSDPAKLLPTKEEVVAHLKLLHGFKRKIEDSYSFGAKKWQLCLNLFSSRFEGYLYALRAEFPRPSDTDALIDFVHEIIPPIDILLTWYTFLMNPKSFHATLCSSNFEAFTLCPFPLLAAAKFVDQSGKFKVLKSIEDQYFSFIMKYDRTKIHDLRDFVPKYNWKPPIVCPLCNKRLGFFLVTEDDASGWADKSFRKEVQNKCSCFKESHIDHGILRKLTLLKDAQKENVLPPVAKYYDPDTMNGGEKDIKRADAKVKRLVAKLNKYSGITDLIKHEDNLDPLTLCVLRDYSEMHITSFVEYNADRVVFREDLIASLGRQQRFIEQLDYHEWIDFEYIHLDIDKTIERYRQFFSLMQSAPHLLVPTLDIDLVWHTHLLDYERYRSYSRHVTGKVIDHHDKIEENRLYDAFTKTCILFQVSFGEEYSSPSICSKMSQIKKLVHKKNKRGFYSSEYISDHNAIRVPSRYSSTHPGTSKLIPTPKPPSLSPQFSDVYVSDPHYPSNTSTPVSSMRLYANPLGYTNPDVACAWIPESEDTSMLSRFKKTALTDEEDE